MSEEDYPSGTVTGEVSPDKQKRNGNKPHEKRKRTAGTSSVPGLNIRELYAERNWTALAGLTLIGIGFLYVIQDVLNFRLNLWSLVMVGLGGWLMADAWQTYQVGRVWAGNSRNRMLSGAIIVLVGALGMMDVNWWGLLLIGVGGWLGYDTWQKYEANGRVWTTQTRNRMFAAAALGVVGIFGFIHLGSAWLLLIIVGAVMLYRCVGRSCC